MLTASEEKIIRDTWAEIATDLKGNGGKVFIRFFTDFPEHQKVFKSFANVELENLPNNKRFLAHAFTVMNAIDGMVDNLDDPEMLDEMLLKTGVNHERRKLKGESFDEFQSSFMGYLESTFKDKWTADIESAWTTVVSTIISKIKDGMDAAN